ncbi:MAG: tetratricopeptide repeat protein, partial [Cytophagales bacterium]
YMSESYENAIKNLKKLNPTNIYGQYAAYYLGLCYLKSGNKAFAVNAFVQSAKLNYDEKEIKPLALFYSGKTHFDLRNFDDAAFFLKDYIKKFPNHPNHQEANELLGEALLNTSNFSDAIAYVENSKNRSKRLNATYQKVTFYKAMEFFNDGEFEKSLELLDKSLAHQLNNKFTQQGYFWKGEALSFQKKYDLAIESYSKMPNDDPLLNTRSFYGLAYANFNLKRYDKSAEWFKKFLDAPEAKQFQSFYADAQLRMADNFYATKKYEQAIEMYDRCMSNPHMQDHEHAIFHKAVVLWLSGKYDQSRETFDFLIRRYPQSRYFDNALYQRSELELERGAYKEAVNNFTVFIEKVPNSQLVPHALLKKGIAYSNLKNYKEAEKNYKLLLQQFPKHELSVTALQSLQDVLNLDGRGEEFEEDLQSFKDKNPESSGLEKIDYESIKSSYLAEKYAIVRKNFKDFEKKYPESGFLDEMNFYYAEASYRTKDTSEALTYYQKVIENGKTIYTNRSIRTSAELETGKRNHAKAVKLYLNLNAKAVNKKELQSAWMGLMENYFALTKYDSSLIFAKQVLSLGNVQMNAINKSSLFAAKSLLMKKDTLASQQYLLELLNTAQDEFGAEGNYLFAKLLYHQKDFKQSLDKLFYLNEKYANYQKWVNQSFLLIAENYISLGEIFQANATLNSIIEHSKDDSIVQQAKNRMEKIKSNSTEERK